MLFTARGEFGTKTVEAENILLAAQEVAEDFAGLDCDEICRDPWDFSLTDNVTDDMSKFLVEWTPLDGLIVTQIDDDQLGQDSR